MGAIADLWKSERGLVAIGLIIGATVLVALNHMSIEQWLDYTKWIFGMYAGAKTVTGVVDALTSGRSNVAGTAAGTAPSLAEPATKPEAAKPEPAKPEPAKAE